ncbi:MAG TPA: contractile injection system tape measure protein, partial [Algoriphagus sp.]|nr:contractile injection system tape measure protein [Algoriphagus sp.]
SEKVWAKWIQTPSFKKSSVSSISQARSEQAAKVKFLELVKTNLAESKSSISDSIKKASQTSPSEKLDLDETILISNSGLVLTAPFLPFFFKGLGLVENKQFVSPESQNRAVLLLQALLDDSYEYEESDLLLNKILCGLEPTEPIQVRFSPTDIEKEEIKNLLDSMVSQWSALKSTSGASMAKGFFHREGSLKRTSKGHQLTVPRISIDILLNRLPWTISIIKLPWMNEPLFTEW